MDWLFAPPHPIMYLSDKVHNIFTLTPWPFMEDNGDSEPATDAGKYWT
jgi:hypothetical protein